MSIGLIIWFGVTLAVTAFMPFHQSDNGAILGRYSPSYAAMIAVMLVLLMMSLVAMLRREQITKWWVNLRENWRPSPIFSVVVAMFAPIGAAALWYFIPGSRIHATIVLFQLYILALWIGASLLVIEALGGQSLSLVTPVEGVLVVVTVGIVLVLVALYLGDVPSSVTFDEPWIANWGVSLYQTGQPVVTMLPTHTPERVLVGQATLPFLGWWLSLTGVNLQSGRFFWLIVCWIGIPFIYELVRSLYGRSAAVVSFVIMMMLPLLQIYLRPDSFVVPALSIGLFALWRGFRSGSSLWYFISGLAIGFTIEGHPLALRFALAFAIYFMVDYGLLLWRERRWVWYKTFWAFAAGGIVFAGFYLWYHSIGWGVSIGDFLATYTSSYAIESGMERFDANNPLTLFVTWFQEYMVHTPLTMALLVAGVVGAIWRFRNERNTFERVILTVYGLSLLIYFFIMPKMNIFYMIFELPFAALWGAALMMHISKNRKITLVTASFALSLIGVIVAQTVLVGQSSTSAQGYIDVSYQLDGALPPEIEHVSGHMIYYYGLSGRDFIFNGTIAQQPPQTWPEAFNRQSPQALIFTQSLDELTPFSVPYVANNDMVRILCDRLPEEISVYILPELVETFENEADVVCE